LHTSFSRDWSSDVCSSDLTRGTEIERAHELRALREAGDATCRSLTPGRDRRTRRLQQSIRQHSTYARARADARLEVAFRRKLLEHADHRPARDTVLRSKRACCRKSRTRSEPPVQDGASQRVVEPAARRYALRARR